MPDIGYHCGNCPRSVRCRRRGQLQSVGRRVLCQHNAVDIPRILDDRLLGAKPLWRQLRASDVMLSDAEANGFTAEEVELVHKRLSSTHWKRKLPTVAMVSHSAIGERI